MKRYWLTAIAVCMACSDSVGPAPEVTRSTTPNAPQAHFVTVAPGVRLEVLDYGGTGAPLVLLAGSGNTAHVFAAFAWRFTDRFHVIAITRRGLAGSGTRRAPRRGSAPARPTAGPDLPQSVAPRRVSSGRGPGQRVPAPAGSGGDGCASS